MKTAAAYLRVSDERQDEFSPDSQLKLIRDYCARNDLSLPDELVFYDDGISAKSVKKRKQFNDMIALAKQKNPPFTVILVWKFSRFARNQEESIVYKSMLKKNGVDVVSISEPIQDNPFGGLIERIIEWMDEYYLIRLSDEVRRGMTERATRGLPNTHAPFGYKMKDGEYFPDEESGKWVRQIFDWYTNGITKRQISIRLRDLNVRNQNGNILDHRNIDYILNNPVYLGYVRWNPHNRTSSKRKFGDSTDIVVKSTHEPLISEETWNKTQELLRLDEKKYPYKAKTTAQKNNYMLRGIVKCSNCGATLVYSTAGGASLQCNFYAKGKCTVSHNIKIEYIDRLVIEQIKADIKSMQFTLKPDIKKQPTEVLSIDYEKLLNSERTKLERAKLAYQDGVDTLEEYKTTKQKIEARIKDIESEQQKALQKSSGISLDEYAQTLTELVEMLESPAVPPELKNEALRTSVEKVIFYRPEKRVKVFYQ
ncbi:MAG: recombinase family protein [Clostridia bacterium]|nr:recombinase family protein [Clostridia bacterium]